MDSNLLVNDMDLFLNKYTRFMTKDIYISNKMYSSFLGQYSYLFDILDKDRFLYNNNKLYKKIRDISLDKGALVRLHNQKYLERAIVKYESFFSGIKLKNKLDVRGKKIVLLEEENTYVVGSRNKDSLVVGKIKYLVDCKGYNQDSILVLSSEDKDLSLIKSSCIENYINVRMMTLRDYSREILSDFKMIDNNKLYDILIEYIINDLFLDKKRFNSFYKAFSKYIYLNKDYKDYDTFKDYHNYMYKRKFLASKLSLKKFNEKEINVRKLYLRTIKNEVLKYKEEVDIANFLYLNSIEYVYDFSCDLFRLLDRDISIKYINDGYKVNKSNKDRVIYLYKSYDDKKNYLSVLGYELIKERYPLELVNEEELYTKLSSTNIGNYFSEFVMKYLIPLINYYDCNKFFDKVNLDEEAVLEFIKIYDYYVDYLKKNNFITERDLLKRVSDSIRDSGYKYLFLLGDMEFDSDISTFTLVDEYSETELLSENIKLLYDYKKYLYDNQSIPIMHTYFGKGEISSLTRMFLRENLDIINESLANCSKEVVVFEYDDSNRLHVYANIGECCYSFLKNNKGNCVMAFRDYRDINILVGSDRFVKVDKNTLLFDNKKEIGVMEIFGLDKGYDTIVLPYLIRDSYHDDLFRDSYLYRVKVMLYVALNKCRHKLVLLCPRSKMGEVSDLLLNFKLVSKV